MKLDRKIWKDNWNKDVEALKEGVTEWINKESPTWILTYCILLPIMAILFVIFFLSLHFLPSFTT